MIKFDRNGNVVKIEKIDNKESKKYCKMCNKEIEILIDRTTKGSVCGRCFSKLLSKE